MTRPEERPSEPTMDPLALYHEEIFTDRKVGMIRQLTPVRADGSRDLDRNILYVGEAELLTTVGTLPLSFEIDARSLNEAVTKYAGAAKEALERAARDLQELRRQAASSLVIPEPGAAGFGLGTLPGGRIKLT